MAVSDHIRELQQEKAAKAREKARQRIEARQPVRYTPPEPMEPTELELLAKKFAVWANRNRIRTDHGSGFLWLKRGWRLDWWVPTPGEWVRDMPGKEYLVVYRDGSIGFTGRNNSRMSHYTPFATGFNPGLSSVEKHIAEIVVRSGRRWVD